jgi:hypothetical protein
VRIAACACSAESARGGALGSGKWVSGVRYQQPTGYQPISAIMGPLSINVSPLLHACLRHYPIALLLSHGGPIRIELPSGPVTGVTFCEAGSTTYTLPPRRGMTPFAPESAGPILERFGSSRGIGYRRTPDFHSAGALHDSSEF